MPPSKPKEKIEILLVDSHEQSRHVIAIMLHKLGYPNVKEAADAASAMKILEGYISKNSGMAGLLGNAAPKEKCDLDLMILDHDLGSDEGGIGVLANLRVRFKPDQLAVLYTAMKGKEAGLTSAASVGANDTLLKPFPLDTLKVKVEAMAGVDRPPVIQSFSLGGAPAKAALLPKTATASPAAKVDEAEAAKAKADAVAAEMKLPDPQSFAHTLAPYLPKMVGDPPEEEPSASSGDRVAIVSGAKEAVYSTDGPVTARLVDGAINGHYHEKVNVIGGGQNCYWARQIDDDKVQLEILSQKGRTTGMVAKTVSLERFMYTFYLCKDDLCPILIRLA